MTNLVPFIIIWVTIWRLSFTQNSDNETSIPVEQQFYKMIQPHYAEMKSAKILGSYGHLSQLNASSCSLKPELQEEIASYKDTVQRIVDTVLRGSFKGTTYQELTEFLTDVGNRPSGSDNLEAAIDLLDKKIMDMQLSNHNLDPVTIPIYQRGVERAAILSPIEYPLEIRGYGMSVHTPPAGVTGQVIHIEGLYAVELLKDQIEGKIVLFNSHTGDDEINGLFGPAMASRHGAIAVLCKSPYKSIYTVLVLYDDTGNKAPAAFVGQEDADKLEELVLQEPNVTVNILLRSNGSVESAKTRQSWNLIGDWNGKENSTEYVLLISHSDSWDQGEGAHDDGVGIFLALQTLALMKELELKPRRTLRNVIFTTEEMGLYGVSTWVEWHKNDLDKYSAGLEADQGCMQATGFIVSGTREAACIIQEIENLLEEVEGFSSGDGLLLSEMEVLPTNLFVLREEGLPGIELNGDRWGEYYELHHTELDSRDALDANQLDRCLALMASTAYIVADLTDKLPRE